MLDVLIHSRIHPVSIYFLNKMGSIIFRVLLICIDYQYKVMNMNGEMDKVFLQRMKSMRKEQLTNMLRCNICQGLFRFAHTIVDCGHTFCQICIFNYIKGFKGRNPVIKCPQCHIPVQTNYKRSIIRDIFKQTLVDTLAPQFAKEDQIIVKRVHQLFPQYDLEYLFEQFKFATFQMPVKSTKKQTDCTASSKLPQKIKEKFGVNFQTFCQMIVDEKNFNNFVSILKNGPPDPKIFQLKPKTGRDEQFIGIDNKMKATNLSVVKLKRFVQKKALQRINKTEEVPSQWLSIHNDKLDIKIYLQINGKEINEGDNLEDLMDQHKGFPIQYRLTK